METTQMGQEQNLGQEEKEEEEEEPQQEEEEEEPQEAPPSDAPTEPQPSTLIDDPPVPAPPFDPSRMIGIIRRKSLIKELAAMYHAECLSYCQELLELQRKGDEPLIDLKPPEDLKKDAMRPPKRLKKTR